MTEGETRILVVDDEPQILRYLRTVLGSHGYGVLEAQSAGEARILAASHKPDVILLDLGLPDMDGLEFTRRLREWCSAPILVISARGQEQDKILALDAGADDYLTKPFGTGSCWRGSAWPCATAPTAQTLQNRPSSSWAPGAWTRAAGN